MLNNIFDEKRRLVLGLTVLLALSFAATSLISYTISRESIRNEIVNNELPLTTDNIYSEIQKDLITPVFASSMMAADTFVRDWMIEGEQDASKISRYLTEIEKKYGTVTSFLVSEKSRRYYYYQGILKEVSTNNPLDVWYMRVRTMQAPYEINVDRDEANSDSLTIFVNYRVYDYAGNFIGATGVGLPATGVRELMQRYHSRYQRTIYMTDTQGNLLLSSKGLEDGPKTNIRSIEGLGKLAPNILSKHLGAYQYSREGRDYLLNVRYIPELHWYLFVEKSEDEAYSSIYGTLVVNLGICVVITLIVALLTGVGIGRYQNRLRQAVEKHTREILSALQAASAANQAKNKMLSYIGHDLRTPLVNILHDSRHLADSRGYNARHYQGNIEQNVLHQLELIDELMEYARGELDHLNLTPVPTFLYSLLHYIEEQGKLLSHERNNSFEMRIGVLPPVVIVDAKRLKQILVNLLSNASKFTENGRILLIIEKNEATPSGIPTLSFTVEDTGPGINESDLPNIFLPFERVPSETPGFGLGLAIAQEIVQKMGSRLEVFSQPGNGSRFTFETPLAIAQEAEVLQPATPFPTPAPFGRGKRILLVDRDNPTRDYFCEVLSLADFDIDFADNVEIAIDTIRHVNFDAILIFQSERNDEAWSLLAALHDSTSEHTPLVVLCTAIPPERPQSMPEAIHFSHILLKPVSAEALLDTMRNALVRLPSLLSTEAIPDPDLLQLCEMIAEGRITDIEDWAVSLKQRHPQHSTFAKRVGEAARRVDLAELRRLSNRLH